MDYLPTDFGEEIKGRLPQNHVIHEVYEENDYATVYVTLTCDPTPDVTIPAGTRISSNLDSTIIFETVSSVYVEYPTTTLNVLMVCTEKGVKGNVNAGELTEILDEINGLISASNPSPAIGGVKTTKENLPAILVDKCVGREFGNIERWIYINSNVQTLETATGYYLDFYGEWKHFKRPSGMDDDTYRSHLISICSAGITFTDIKRTLASIFNTTVDKICLSNFMYDYLRCGDQIIGDYTTGTSQRLAGHFMGGNKIMYITFNPDVSFDNDLLEDILPNMVLPGVSVVITSEPVEE